MGAREISQDIERMTKYCNGVVREGTRSERWKLGGVPHQPPSASESGRVLVRQFLEAIQSGDVEQLVGTLASDVVLMSDGGGKVQAPVVLWRDSVG